MRRLTIVLGGLALALGGAAYLNRGEISVALMRRVAANSIFRDTDLISLSADGGELTVSNLL